MVSLLLISLLWLWLAIGLRPVTTSQHDCILLPSVLGPDWYMVPRPIPTQYMDVAGYQREYIHMPCAITTVFDVAVCGCTNLAAYMYSSIESKMTSTNMLDDGNSMGLIKQRDPKDYLQTPNPVGSLLLNTRTGEVTECPFRASPRGGRWYLVMVPSNTWMNMKCARGTMFNKITCSCEHAGLFKVFAKTDEEDIIVLERDHRLDNKISESLNIKVADIDFRPRHGGRDGVPFWRHSSLLKTAAREKSNVAIKPDVLVTGVVTPPDKAQGDKVNTHASRRARLGKVPRRNQTSPLAIDAVETHALRQANIFSEPIVREAFLGINVSTIQSTQVTSAKVQSEIGITHEYIQRKYDNMTDLKVKFLPIKTKVDIKVNNTKRVKDITDPIANECAKKPVPDLGPDYFQQYVWEVGYIPYRCHGDRIYDDLRCACVTANSVAECAKKPIPELGPEYFKMNIWGVGYIPYRCHGNRTYSDLRCACVSKTH